MKTLAIETSCDETAITILSFDKNQKSENKNIEFEVLSNHVLSQINIHREFGGVFPTLAKREHAKNLTKIFEESLKEAKLFTSKNIEENVNLEKIEKIRSLLEREEEMFSELIKFLLSVEKPTIEAITVTSGPGLAPALWVGINFAKALSIFWDIPVYPINHMEGHVVSALIKNTSENKSNKFEITQIETPAIALLISGGHTEIDYFENLGKYKKIGNTLDDAVGEAFDKVARSLSLPYPGGPEISSLAEKSRKENLKIENMDKLPRPMINSKDLNFSFSGLKTAVIYKIKKLQEDTIKEEEIKNKISLDFENAVTEILLKKVKDAVLRYNIKTLIIGGGVIANNFIRQNFTEFCERESLDLHLPAKNLTGDNAFMIGVAGMLRIINGEKDTYLSDIKADSNWSLEKL